MRERCDGEHRGQSLHTTHQQPLVIARLTFRALNVGDPLASLPSTSFHDLGAARARDARPVVLGSGAEVAARRCFVTWYASIKR